jgi:signal transduction histidine kinase
MEPAKATSWPAPGGHEVQWRFPDRDEAARWRRLTEIIRSLTYLSGTRDLLSCFLRGALELLQAERGHISVLNKTSGEFALGIQYGFDHLSEADIAALCASPPQTEAAHLQERVMMEGWESYGAVQATPLKGESGLPIGILTTYSQRRCWPTPSQLELLDALCPQVGALFERAAERESLIGLQRRNDDFLATLAHELRNSVAPLRTSLEVLKMVTLTHPLHQRARAILDRRLHHTTRLIEDILDASRLSCGKLELQKEQVTLASVLESALEIVGPTIDGFSHTLTTSLPASEALVYADPVRLAQAFVNLLQNAAKYTPAGGSICLDARTRAQELVVEVRDSGIGITADVLPRIFELFAQAPGANKLHGGGLGIGLALVKGIIEMHGGSVAVYSDGRDRGSCFTVRLPRSCAL